jgi:hypothetical protein
MSAMRISPLRDRAYRAAYLFTPSIEFLTKACRPWDARHYFLRKYVTRTFRGYDNIQAVKLIGGVNHH